MWCKFGFWESGFGTNECWIYKIVVAWKAAFDLVTDALLDEPRNMALSVIIKDSPRNVVLP